MTGLTVLFQPAIQSALGRLSSGFGEGIGSIPGGTVLPAHAPTGCCLHSLRGRPQNLKPKRTKGVAEDGPPASP